MLYLRNSLLSINFCDIMSVIIEYPHERFESRIERITETGCWIWVGSLIGKDYPQLPSGRRLIEVTHAHRYSYLYFIGPIPEGMQVCHRCDITCCVNPYHLFLGTQQDNEDDKMRKGRQQKGLSHWNCRLTEENVVEIRNSIETSKHLAKKFKIAVSTINRIRSGVRWSHF